MVDDVAPRVRVPRGGRGRPAVLVAIALGGMLGATARYELSRALPAPSGGFPWATFCANLSGSYVLAFVLVVLVERLPPTRHVRPFLAIGVIGAYTTMSTYLVETAVLVKDGHLATAALYGPGSALAGLALAYGGILTARSMLPGTQGAGR
jgi:CrcB protein